MRMKGWSGATIFSEKLMYSTLREIARMLLGRIFSGHSWSANTSIVFEIKS